MSNAFNMLARKVFRELFPAHIAVSTSLELDLVREDMADHVEIRVVDRTGAEPFYGIARIHGRMLRSPQLEDAIRHELRHLAREMGYGKSDKETR